MAERPDPDTDWLALADFLDAHANDMRAWTEDEPKFRATAEGLRQLAAITAERDAAVARAAQLGTGIDSVRSHWHADEGPRWTANVIEALRHSGLMDDVMLSGTPDPDPGPNTLADRLDFMAQHPVGGYRNWNDDLRAAADGLRQYAAITAAIGDPDELGMYEAYAVADNGAGDELRSMLHRLADTLAAADRGDTDGEATDG